MVTWGRSGAHGTTITGVRKTKQEVRTKSDLPISFYFRFDSSLILLSGISCVND